jgi:hypothetical protein
MSLRPSYPDVGVGSGFCYHHKQTDQHFKHPTLTVLHDMVSKFCSVNNLSFSNDEFDDNVCKNTPNIVCTESLRGVGDLVHVVLNPIAGGIDSVLGTKLSGCGGCYKRQQALNK